MDASTPQVEPGIAPLVEAINAWPELETFASCQGHPWRGERPYVAFRTLSQPPVPETIRFLHDLAQQVERAARFDLRHSWTIQGGFHPEYGLVFVLEADGLWHRFWWRQSKVRQDVNTLTKLLRPPTAHSTECTETRASAGLPQRPPTEIGGLRESDMKQMRTRTFGSYAGAFPRQRLTVLPQRRTPMDHTRRIIFLIGALSLLFLGMSATSFAEEPIFLPETQIPLEINEKGFVSKFLEPGFTIAATQTLDVDKDGGPDYIVFYVTKGDLSIGLIHNYGQGPGRYGPAIFYFIRNALGEIVEWAGNPTWAQRPPAPIHRIPTPIPLAPGGITFLLTRPLPQHA